EWFNFELLKCPMCTGYWVAICLGLFVVGGGSDTLVGSAVAVCLVAAASSGITWILSSIAVAGFAAKEFFNISTKQKLREELTMKIMEKKIEKQ
ncbi:MAG: hypothetical protein KAS32_05245, partial [Candidatus Peribacteraceae bacterium]|nr:hypothetical protein [Candidatus Peribacteraceae bacterium]